MKYIILYLLIINALAFALMLIDKQKAKKKKWRIKEATLMGVAALGGSIGALAGMYTFRHKTLHKKFSLGIPAILGAQLAIGAFLIYIFFFR